MPGESPRPAVPAFLLPVLLFAPLLPFPAAFEPVLLP